MQKPQSGPVRSTWIFWALAFLASLFLGGLVLKPGVTGPFLFDDFVNINRLGIVGCVTDTYSLLWYAFGGGNATGRPLAFLSFLLQDFCWPTNPQPMKEFNVLWHLLNFCLLVWFLIRIFRLIRLPAYTWAALAIGAVWVIHPVHVSAVFLTIQRMTLMMSTCILGGLLLYLRGRELVPVHPLRGHAFMWGGMALGGIVGSLFKETAVGMPFYVLALELTLLATLPRGDVRLWRLFAGLCLAFPVILVFGYILLDPSGSIDHNWAKRDYNAFEKILTECRILFGYIRQLLVPDLSGFGIYQSGIRVSHSFFNPVTTMASVAGWLVVLSVAVWQRHRFPLISCGVLWFFGGHFLEAMVLPIELYFEHRNYLPSLGILLVVLGVFLVFPEAYRRHLGFLLAALTLVFSFMTYSNARVWGDSHDLAATWYLEQPDSIRATQQYIKSLREQNRSGDAARVLKRFVAENRSNDITMAITAFDWICPENAKEQWAELVAEARQAKVRNNIGEAVNNLIFSSNCEYLELSDIRRLIRSLMSNPDYVESDRFRRNLFLLYAYSYRQDGNLSQAMYFADQAYEIRPIPMIPRMQAIWLLEAGLDDLALEFLDKALDTPEETQLIRLKGRPELKALKESVLTRIAIKKAAKGEAGACSGNDCGLGVEKPEVRLPPVN